MSPSERPTAHDALASADVDAVDFVEIDRALNLGASLAEACAALGLEITVSAPGGRVREMRENNGSPDI